MSQKKLSYEKTLFCDKNAEVIGISETEEERERGIFSAIKIVTDETVLMLEAFNEGNEGYTETRYVMSPYTYTLPRIQIQENYEVNK